MNLSVERIGDVVTIRYEGMLDSVSAPIVHQELQTQLASQGDIDELVWNASELTYLSSSGLRVLLGLKKQYPCFHIVEVGMEVFDILDLTGFTQIIPTERKLREVSIDGCELVGKGGVGTVYRLSDDTIIKVFRKDATMDMLNTEMNLAKESFLLGMPTAITFDVVRVGDQLGLVYELLKAKTLSDCIKQHPERLDEYAILYAKLFKQLHSIEVQKGSIIGDSYEQEINQLEYIRRYFDDESVDLLIHIVQSVPKGNRLLHGDLQTKNVMLQDGELMMIDMGEVGYGHPLLDLAHSYSSLVSLVGDYDAIIGFPRKYGEPFWNTMMSVYFEGESAEAIAHRNEQIRVASLVRNFSWLSLSDSFPSEVIKECQEVFKERVKSHKEYIYKMCETFSDWQL